MKRQISEQLIMKYYNFMKASQLGAKCDNKLARKFQISNQSYLACRRMGYLDANGYWISKNVITEKEVKDVIYKVRQLTHDYTKTYIKNMEAPNYPIEQKIKPTISISDLQLNRENPFLPQDKKEHKATKEISIAWGLIKILY
jgi:hypothetical protein